MQNTKNNCGNSCGCSSEEIKKNLEDKKKLNSIEVTTKPQKSQNEKEDDQKLDPTHFGDWQVNCRTIDF